MLTLYHNDMSVCAQKVRLCLAEKGLPYEAKHLNLRAGDQQQPDYLKLNPKGVVPTLVDDDTVVVESIVINEYLDDAFPKRPLKPNDPAGRAKMRWWTKQIDDSIFGATGTVSMSIAFHHQYTPEVLDELIRQRGPAYRARFALLQQGVNNPNFPDAIKRLYKMVADMNAALERGPWLCGEMFTLADIAYAPYLTRLDHLKFLGFLDKHKRAADWYERMKARASYRTALAAQFNAKYLPLMDEKGREAWPRVKELVGIA
ncbi:MAG TPA: glutathione S-transferase family protein [Stellaceae bacterium]|nr:glutathione S-transferase family protein [Stellaceae bacterium]